MNFKRNLLALVAMVASLNALAAPTATWTTSDSHVYAHSTGFESTGTLADNTVLTNQFASEGVVFSGTARANGCGTVASTGWSAFGMSGENYVNTFGPGCTTNNVVDTLSMKFSSGLTRLAMDAYIAQNAGNSDVMQVLDDGQVVASFTLTSIGYLGLAQNSSDFSTGRYLYNHDWVRSGTLVIDANGGRFDELRFIESAQGASSGDFMFVDNLRFDANAVPEPASLALVAIGLAACGLRRRKA